MNPNLDDGNCFQYAIMVALKHEISKTNPVRRKKRHFKNQYMSGRTKIFLGIQKIKKA